MKKILLFIGAAILTLLLQSVMSKIINDYYIPSSSPVIIARLIFCLLISYMTYTNLIDKFKL